MQYPLTRRMILEKSPALACSRVPVPLRVRNIRLMYQGTAMVMSGSVHDTRACPSKCWGEGMTVGVQRCVCGERGRGWLHR